MKTPLLSELRANSVRQLEELPGIADIVWGTVTRLASARVQTSVLFTAAEKSAGTSVLASATAIGLAQHQRVPVCLLETNVRRPALAGYLGLERTGLSDVLDGRAELEDCLQVPRGCPGLFVLPAGTPRDPVSGEFTTDRLISILARLEERCHYLVLDAAPLLENVESRLLLRHADGVMLVLRARATRLSDAERAHDVLVESGTPILGSIFNAYKSDGFTCSNGRASRSFRRTDCAERPGANGTASALNGAAVRVGIGETLADHDDLAASTNGGPHPGNGNGWHALDGPEPSAGDCEGHLSQIDILQRRIAKLTLQLEQTEADLKRIAAMKNVDLGIASTYRTVQGLLSEDEAYAYKEALLKRIFEANLELKAEMARR